MKPKRLTRDVPGWGETRAPRILIENRDTAMVWADERVLRRVGYETRSCPGPAGPRDAFPFGGCQLVERGTCPLAEGADAIVFGLGLGHPQGQRVLGALRFHIPATPVCIDASAAECSKDPGLAIGCALIPFPDRGEGLVSAVRGALDRARAPMVPVPTTRRSFSILP